MMRAEGRTPPPEALPPPTGSHPEIDRWLIDAFFTLSTERAIGMGVGPIPWSAIVAYADRAGLDRRAGEAFVTIIRTLDVAYLNEERAREESKSHG